VAISVVFPVACQRVVAILLSQWLVIRQSRDDGDEITLQRLPVRSFCFAFLDWLVCLIVRIKHRLKLIQRHSFQIATASFLHRLRR